MRKSKLLKIKKSPLLGIHNSTLVNFIMVSQIFINFALLYKINSLLNDVNTNYQNFFSSFLNILDNKLKELKSVENVMELPLSSPVSLSEPVRSAESIVAVDSSFWSYCFIAGVFVCLLIWYNSSPNSPTSPNLPVLPNSSETVSTDNLSGQLVNSNSPDTLFLSCVNSDTVANIDVNSNNLSNSILPITPTNLDNTWSLTDFLGFFFGKKQIFIAGAQNIQYTQMFDIVETIEIVRTTTTGAIT